MGQTTNQVENLSLHLQQLESKVKPTTDWKQHFQNHPGTMLGVAFAGGLLMAAMLGSATNRRSTAASIATETWENIKGALFAVTSAHVQDLIGEVVPTLAGQFQHTKAPATASSVAQ